MAAKKKPAYQDPSKKNRATTKDKPKPSGDKPGPLDNIVRGLKTGERFVREVSGVADVERFVKNPLSVKNAASLGLTVAAYAAGPIAKTRQITKSAQAAQNINRTMEARAAAAAAAASNTPRTVKAYKGAGTITTKAKSTVGMTGIKSFTTGKNPVRAAASTRVQVAKDAQQAAKDAKALLQKNVTRGKMAAASLATGKTASTASVVKQENKNKKKKK